MHYVYLLRSINFPSKKYIGFTDNILERLDAHNHGSSLHTTSSLSQIAFRAQLCKKTPMETNLINFTKTSSRQADFFK